MFTHGSLFSGIGGFDLAAKWNGINNLFQVEIDEFCQKVLTKNFPETIKYKDIKEFNANEYKQKITILSGGFPCQPFSVAGKRKGTQDERYLWAEMLRVISEIKPKWIVAENVYGLVTNQNGMVFNQIIIDLENCGYEIQTFIIPACAKNAPHKRERIWIVANSRLFGSKINEIEATRTFKHNKDVTNSNNFGFRYNDRQAQKQFARSSWQSDWYEVATEFCRVGDGIPNRLDRLKSLGNAIVPQIAFEIFRAIIEVELSIS